MTELFVNMGQMHVLKAEGLLTTVGLGSCIGLTLYDPVTKVGGMAHVFLSQSRKPEEAARLPGKYADTAVPALIKLVVSAGAQRSRLVAKMAGGAHLFPNLSSGGKTVGDQNIAAVTQHLKTAGIPLLAQDVAGAHGRKMKMSVSSGVVVVTAIGKEPREI